MDKYTIYCTEEQTKKALDFGAPIKYIDESKISFEEKQHSVYIPSKWGYFLCPTAEQMFGWLEEQGIWVHFCKPNQRPELLSFSVSKRKEPFKRCFIGGEFSTREKATLAAIDATLNYLSKNKK